MSGPSGSADRLIRGIRPDEVEAYTEAVVLQFGGAMPEGLVDFMRAVSDPDRSFAAFEGERIVGTAQTITFTMGVPGARPAPCAGLTAVGVHPARRRRGILSALMRRHLEDAHERGEPFSALYASEGRIYGRYGYGPAAPSLHLEVDTAFSDFRVPAAEVDAIDLVDPRKALDALVGVYDRAQAATPGMMSRSRTEWEAQLALDPPSWRKGFTSPLHALLDDRGYVTYRLKEGWADNVPDGTLRIEELVATDAEATAALWRFCLDMDLVARVEAGMRPPDDPLTSTLADAPRARVRASEALHLRVLSLPDAVAARGWEVDGGVVLSVGDRWCPWNAGTWRLEVGPDGGTCERVDAEPDLGLDIAELSAAFLGGVRVTSLLRARCVVEHHEGAARRLDRLLAADPLPWNARGF